MRNVTQWMWARANAAVLRVVVFCAAGLIASPGFAGAADEPVTLERPMSLTVRTSDDRTIAGRMTVYDLSGFTLVDRQDESHRIAWTDLDPSRALGILTRLHEARDAEAWLRLGAAVRAWEGGEPFSERALTRAVRLDRGLADRAERIRRGEPDRVDDGPAGNGALQGVGPGEELPELAGGPVTVGEAQPQFWGVLPPEENARSIDQLKAFAERGLQQVNVPMRLLETEFFLFYTDLDRREAEKWASLLDRMYGRLCDLFGVDRRQNIWRGKALILVFRRDADFHRFEDQVHGLPSIGRARGRCWSFGDGRVHITFYRQANEAEFAHVLVHEAVHGFLHRYRSPIHIPSVWNEGLAEVIAMELVPHSGTVPARQRSSESLLRRRGDLGGVFELRQIDAWHYGLASGLTAMMIRENRRGYVAFINGIKDGQPWRESLEQNYGVSLERLIAFYGQQVGVRGGLRP
jgi:hypothetical protein